ncbi:MAG: hypothetical protein J6P83_00890 [Bacteroidales bacterium]|nr:hypothetical protein [Bacteroidales bacterium]
MTAMKKTVIILAIAVNIVLAMTQCKKESPAGDSIMLLGTEDYVRKLTEIIPEEWQNDFFTYYGDIPQGYIPPNIEGEYVISPKQFVYSNFIDLSDDLDMHLKVTDQHNRVAVVEFHEGETLRIDTAYIMGSGQNFSLYFEEERTMNFYGSLSSVKRLVLITGEKKPEGIQYLRFGSMILDVHESVNPFIGTFVPGWFFIYKDRDDLAENCHWFGQRGGKDSHD